MSPISQEDDMVISPPTLNALCASALFSEGALNSLCELVEKQDTMPEDNGHNFQQNPPDTSVVIPCKLISLYGDIFVELARLVSQQRQLSLNLHVRAAEIDEGYGLLETYDDDPTKLIGQRLDKIQKTLNHLLLTSVSFQHGLNNRPTQLYSVPSRTRKGHIQIDKHYAK
ncbi:hypothetical protein CPB86DRAFT_802675 [Serendipita vermifera]|nr:hypothetical protein CPB86DRAFT_802675 [Serendipita vermifera]